MVGFNPVSFGDDSLLDRAKDPLSWSIGFCLVFNFELLVCLDSNV
jgi:hypothetical protein